MSLDEKLRRKWFRECEKIIKKNKYFDPDNIVDETWSSYEICSMFDTYNKFLFRKYYKRCKNNNPEYLSCISTINDLLEKSNLSDEVNFRTFIVGSMLDAEDSDFSDWVSSHFDNKYYSFFNVWTF